MLEFGQNVLSCQNAPQNKLAAIDLLAFLFQKIASHNTLMHYCFQAFARCVTQMKKFLIAGVCISHRCLKPVLSQILTNYELEIYCAGERSVCVGELRLYRRESYSI